MDKDTVIEDIGSRVAWAFITAMIFGFGAMDMIHYSGTKIQRVVPPKEAFQKCVVEVASEHHIDFQQPVTKYNEVVISTWSGRVQKNYDLQDGVISVKIKGQQMPARPVADLPISSPDRITFDGFKNCYQVYQAAEAKL